MMTRVELEGKSRLRAEGFATVCQRPADAFHTNFPLMYSYQFCGSEIIVTLHNIRMMIASCRMRRMTLSRSLCLNNLRHGCAVGGLKRHLSHTSVFELNVWEARDDTYPTHRFVS